MGQEIELARFGRAEFAAFEEHLRQETELLQRWFEEGAFSNRTGRGGFELEAWLVDRDGYPAGINQTYLQRLDNPLVVAELATFNVELNSTPLKLQGDALSRMAQELEATWVNCNRVAEELGARLAMVGILPTVSERQLNLAHMSPLRRYRALNEQILRLRAGCPIELDIRGVDRLRLRHRDVMLESAATSFQIHLKVGAAESARVYNVSKMISAPMVATCANSPYLFGHQLWEETRIPLFEQAVSVGVSDLTKRVSFGIRYAQGSLVECFQANLARYPVLLPQVMEEPAERLAHLRLHNGTIWRWNRPLIGFDRDGTPHLRVEHRVVPAGPTVTDSIANAALYFGLVRALVDWPEPPETRLPFEQARSNFYAAAREGLAARVLWLDRRRVGLEELLLGELLPMARRGLARLGVEPDEIAVWLGVIEARVRTGRTGAAWQRAFVNAYGADMQTLTQAYLEHQGRGAPVHEWPV
jgi:gamma-glutamyl:cysteine ligase YbdK (ATP-grasp superfamily)